MSKTVSSREYAEIAEAYLDAAIFLMQRPTPMRIKVAGQLQKLNAQANKMTNVRAKREAIGRSASEQDGNLSK